MKINIKKFILMLLLINIKCQEDNEKPVNIKVVPARLNKLTLDDLDEIKMEVLHDMNTQLKDLEDEMAEKERLKEKTSSTWSLTGAPIYLPRNPVYPSISMPNSNQLFYANLKNKMFPDHNSVFNEQPVNNLNTSADPAGSSAKFTFKELEDELKEADEAIDELRTLKNSGKDAVQEEEQQVQADEQEQAQDQALIKEQVQIKEQPQEKALQGQASENSNIETKINNLTIDNTIKLYEERIKKIFFNKNDIINKNSTISHSNNKTISPNKTNLISFHNKTNNSTKIQIKFNKTIINRNETFNVTEKVKLINKTITQKPKKFLKLNESKKYNNTKHELPIKINKFTKVNPDANKLFEKYSGSNFVTLNKNPLNLNKKLLNLRNNRDNKFSPTPTSATSRPSAVTSPHAINYNSNQKNLYNNWNKKEGKKYISNINPQNYYSKQNKKPTNLRSILPNGPISDSTASPMYFKQMDVQIINQPRFLEIGPKSSEKDIIKDISYNNARINSIMQIQNQMILRNKKFNYLLNLK